MRMARRDFLGSILAAAAGAAAKPVRVAMLGAQHSHAADKLRVLSGSADYDVAGVCEPDPAARQPLSGVRSIGEAELLGDKSTELVVVECHPWEAIAWGRKVIAAGKHLHLEKPPGDKMEPFRELLEEARQKKLLVQLGYVLRFNLGIQSALEAARRGELGEVFQLRAAMHTDIAPNRRAELARYPGGMMFELGGHLIDRVVDLLGRPRQVRSWLRHDSGLPDKLADNCLAVLEYDRCLAVISSAARQAGASQHRYLEILGTDGSILVQPLEPGVKVRITTRKGGTSEGGAIPPVPRFVGDFADLARAIRAGQPLKYSYEHELLVQETLLRACS